MLAKGWIATRLRRLPPRYVETTISSVRNGVFLLKEQRLGFKPKQAVVTNYISTSYSTKNPVPIHLTHISPVIEKEIETEMKEENRINSL